METITHTTINPFVENKVRAWFDELIAAIRADQISLETNVAPPEKEKLYKTFILGSELDMCALARTQTSMTLVQNLVIFYFSRLNETNQYPLKLAIDYTDAKVLVWAEVDDDDETTEDALLLTEAKVNAKFSTFGFDLSTIIVEKSDNLKIPPQYKIVSGEIGG